MREGRAKQTSDNADKHPRGRPGRLESLKESRCYLAWWGLVQRPSLQNEGHGQGGGGRRAAGREGEGRKCKTTERAARRTNGKAGEHEREQRPESDKCSGPKQRFRCRYQALTKGQKTARCTAKIAHVRTRRRSSAARGHAEQSNATNKPMGTMFWAPIAGEGTHK